ncbi:MAG: hypothetical protein LBM96_10640 [Methanobrevibacter sp.]|jgi:hypothetical protein|nr:hypothetical protein [Candidatus Methanoflexus mossambicus]
MDVISVEAKIIGLLNINGVDFPALECRFYKSTNKIQIDFILPDQNMGDYEEKINKVLWKTLKLCPSVKLEKNGRLMIIDYNDIKEKID